MSKEFFEYNLIRDDAFKLAYQIYLDGFIPDVIYVSLRGGAYLGNVVGEFFKFVRKGQRPVFYAAVVARSYTDIHHRHKVMVDGWTYSPEHLRSGDRILIVDDIFDTGRTVNHLVGVVMDKGIPREDIKVAVHDYKIREYVDEKLPIQPDYYSRKYVIPKPEDDQWIHYLSHELVGLERDEIESHFADQEVRDILKRLL